MVLGSLGNLVSDAQGSMGQALEQAPGSENGERTTFTENTFHQWTGGSLTDGNYVELARYQVPAQTGYTWGFGEPAPGKSDNQGRIYFEAQGTATDPTVVGKLRLNSMKSTGKGRDDHGAFHTSETNQNLQDRTTWPFLPERDMPIVGQDSIMYMEFKYDAAASADSVVDQGASTLRLNLTEFS